MHIYFLCGIIFFMNIYGSYGDDGDEAERGDEKKRVHAGIRAKEKDFKFALALRVSADIVFRDDENHSSTICTASLIGPHFVLTAAHCIPRIVAYCLIKGIEAAKAEGVSFSNAHFGIFAGTINMERSSAHSQTLEVSHPSEVTMHLHPEAFHVPNTPVDPERLKLKRDFLVLQLLKDQFEFNDFVQAVPLLKMPIPEMVDDMCRGMGFGRQNDVAYKWDGNLYWLPLEVGGAKYCEKLKGTKYKRHHHVCGLGKGMSDTCQGDSGGPVVCGIPPAGYYLVGVLSAGVDNVNAKINRKVECSKTNTSFGVYGFSGELADWLTTVTSEPKFLTHQEAAEMQNMQSTTPYTTTRESEPSTFIDSSIPVSKPTPKPPDENTDYSEETEEEITEESIPKPKYKRKRKRKAESTACSLYSVRFWQIVIQMVLLFIVICNSDQY